MKKFKIVLLCLTIILSSSLLFACTGKKKNKINVEGLNFVYEETDVNKIEVAVGQEIELKVKYVPENADNLDFVVLAYETNLLTITQDSEDKCLFKVKISNDIESNTSTEVGVALKYNAEIQAKCTIDIKKDYEQLSAPTNVEFNNTQNRLEWTPISVDNVQDYTIDVNGEIYTSNTNSLDFSAINKFDEELTVKVKANGPYNFYDSQYSNEYKFTKLSAPQQLSHKNCNLSWVDNKLAVKYDLDIQNLTIQDYNQDSVTSQDLDKVTYNASNFLQEAGTYNVKVRAVGDETKNIFSSNFTEALEIVRLQLPQGYKLENNTLSWKTSLGAKGYLIIMNGTTISEEVVSNPMQVQDLYFNITEEFLNDLTIGENGQGTGDKKNQFEFSIKALGDGEKTLDSAITKIASLTKLDTNEISVKTEELDLQSHIKRYNVISWLASEQTDAKYELELIYNDNGKLTTQNIQTTQTKLVLDKNFASGIYKVRVRSLGDGVSTFSGNYSNQIQVKKLNPVDISTITYNAETGDLTFKTFDATSFDVLVNSKQYSVVAQDIQEAQDGNYNKIATISLLDKIENAGNSTIKIISKYLDYVKTEDDVLDGYVDSELSSVYTISKLESPNLNVLDNRKIVVSGSNNVSGYLFEIYQTISSNEEVEYDLVTSFTTTQNVVDVLDLEDENNQPLIKENKTYAIKVKSIGKNDTSISSNYSNYLNIQLLSSPVVTNEDGKLSIQNKNVNASSFDFYVNITGQDNSVKITEATYLTETGYASFLANYAGNEINVYAVANGKEANGIAYLTSNNGLTTTFYQLGKISDISLQNQVLYFNPYLYLDKDDAEDVYDVTYRLKFYAKNEQDENYSELINVDGFKDEVLLTILNTDDLTNGKVSYALSEYINKCLQLKNENNELIYNIANNNVNFKVEISALSDNNKLLKHNETTELEFTKLQTVSLSVTNYEEMLANADSFSERNLSGLLKFSKVNNAYDYTLNAYDSNNELIYSKNIGQFTTDYATYRFDDKITTLQSYNFKIIANGNGTNVISSEVFELNDVQKFNAPKLYIDKGLIRWDTSLLYKAFYVLEINGSTFVFYDLEKLKDDLGLVEQLGYIGTGLPSILDGEILTSDQTYNIAIYAIPLNATEKCLVSSRFTINNVKRLPTSTHTYVKDGKFYFSKVENANGYNLYINGEGFEIKLNEDYFEAETINNVGYYYYDFASRYGSNPGEYNIFIQAKTNAENMVNSNASLESVVNVMELSQINIVDGVLNYSNINGAIRYEISIKEEDTGRLVYEDTIENNRLANNDYKIVFDENFKAGKYLVEIKACGNETEFITNLDISSKIVEKLETPSDLKINLGKIVWNDVIKDGCYYSIITKGVTTINGKNIGTNNYYELDNSFSYGNYNSIQIQAMGQYSYLNSDISYSLQSNDGNTSFIATKLTTPTLYTIEGELYLDSADKQNVLYYELNVGGKAYNVGKPNKLVNLAEGLQTYVLDEAGNLVKDEVVVLTGTNDVKLKSIGSFSCSSQQQGYLNSNYSETVTLSILNNVANVKVVNGVLTWQQPSVNGELILHYTLNGNEQIANINGKNSFEFKESGLYEIYFINNGNTTQGKSCFITSIKSKTFKVQKFDTPNMVNAVLNDDGSGNVTLSTDLVDNASGYEFVLNDEFILSNNLNNSIIISVISKSVTINGEKQNVTYLICNGQEYEVKDSYKVSVKVLGDTNSLISQDSTKDENSEIFYLTSDYSEPLVGAIPASPIVKVESVTENNKTFATGKVYWDKVLFDQNIEVDKYLVSGYYFKNVFVSQEQIENTYDYLVRLDNSTLLKVTFGKIYLVPNGDLSLIYDNNNLTAINASDYASYGIKSISEIATTKTYYHVGAEGNYFIFVRSLIISSGTFSSSTSCYLKYAVYSKGDGSKQSPYIISTAEQFANIKYGMDEGIYYELVSDIDLSTIKFSVIGDINNKFNANLNGNNQTIYNVNLSSNNSEYVGLFACVGNTGVISDLTVENALVTDGYYLGVITGYNQGLIKNCRVTGTVYTDVFTLSKEILNGGICALNSGTIDNCSVVDLQINTIYNTVSNYSAYAGGICARNESSGVIKNCEISSSTIGLEQTEGNNKTAQYSGGICAVNMGLVEACVNNGNVYAQNAGNKNAYAGGIVAFNNGQIYNCLNTGSVSAIANVKEGAKSYVGAIVGRNSGDVICSVVINYNGKIVITSKANSTNSRCGIIAGENRGYINQCVINGIEDIELNINDISYPITQANLKNMLIGSGNDVIDASDFEQYLQPIYSIKEDGSVTFNSKLNNDNWEIKNDKAYPKAN